ncbi:MAG TPA: ribosome biogenesis GTPase Der [Eggerthellaceae bacterium]|nr:ribosome biogenesis GTPase Der [Eggerthellaceae bacterium]
MALPLVAVVGRPNVGKSTFVNRITGADEAIVHEMRGVTRDRSYHEADWNGVSFTLVDTGGIEVGGDDDFQASITNQAFTATHEADAIVLIVDGRTGINADDEEVARLLRKSHKPVFLTVNKLDTPNNYDAMYEFYALGLGDPWPVSATHGHGTGDLLDAIVQSLHETGAVERSRAQEDVETGVNVAIIGRPNAGKSSLTNKMTDNERSIVSDVAGTTRDAVDTPVEHDGKRYTIVDTAGLRRKGVIDQDVEYYGFVRAMRAIDRADVAVLVIDGSIGLTDQDQRVARFAHDRGCALVIALNKWDIVEGPEAKKEIRERVADRMMYVGYAPVVAISALSGKNVQRIWAAIDKAYANYAKTIPTNQLNAWLAEVRESGHTISKGKAVLRMKYMTQTGTCPPVFTFFANRPDIVDDNYERYLENRMRKHFDLEGTPIRFKFKKKD